MHYQLYRVLKDVADDLEEIQRDCPALTPYMSQRILQLIKEMHKLNATLGLLEEKTEEHTTGG